jgi:DnaJ-class molecular chaperone
VAGKEKIMAHAEVCPICKGKGTIEKGGNTTDAKFPVTCHGCGGTGWITVNDNQQAAKE